MPPRKSRKDPAEQTRFWEKISLMAEISSRCRAAAVSREAYIEVLALIQNIVPFDAATLYLLDTDGHKLAEKATIGKRVDILDMLHLKKGDGISAVTASIKKAVLLPDRSRKRDFDPECDFVSVLSVPLLVDNEVIGVLNLGCYRPDVLQQKHVKLMTIVADQFAVSIERMNYEEQIRAKNQALEKAHRELQEAQQRLIHTEKLEAISELGASINHEINNPLAVIIGNVQCLRLQASLPDHKSQTRLERIELAALRISEVNRRLLQFESLVLEEYPGSGGRKMLNLQESVES